MRIAYALADAAVGGGGSTHILHTGEHWPADDPVVLANPGMFSEDPRTGLRFSRPPAVDEPVEDRQPARGPFSRK